jgi:hypothetical protein
VTVPAYQALWSQHDVANQHHRRYSRRSLRRAAVETGWLVVRMTGFNSLLLPPAAAVRLAQRLRWGPISQHAPDLELTPAGLNGALELPMRAEAAWIRRGRTIPGGLSQLALLRKPGVASEAVPATNATAVTEIDAAAVAAPGN